MTKYIFEIRQIRGKNKISNAKRKTQLCITAGRIEEKTVTCSKSSWAKANEPKYWSVLQRSWLCGKANVTSYWKLCNSWYSWAHCLIVKNL